jgi:hypothetical protein
MRDTVQIQSILTDGQIYQLGPQWDIFPNTIKATNTILNRLGILLCEGNVCELGLYGFLQLDSSQATQAAKSAQSAKSSFQPSK